MHVYADVVRRDEGGEEGRGGSERREGVQGGWALEVNTSEQPASKLICKKVY